MKILASFPGVGKSHLATQHPELYDIEQHEWPQLRQANPDKTVAELAVMFADRVDSAIQKGYSVFIPAHNEVADELVRRGHEVIFVYPTRQCKDEYIRRMAMRGTHQIAQLFAQRWDELIDRALVRKYVKHVVIGAGQYLSDIVTFDADGFVVKA